MALNKISDQMEMFGYTAEGAQQEADKFVDKDAAPAKDITFMDAAKFVAELTPVIGDAMAAKEVYEELQKEEPNYLLAGALGGATIIGLIPGIGDAAASAIKAGARKTLDVGKRVEVDPDALGSLGGNIRLKPKEEEVTPQLSNIEYQRKMAEFDKAETVDDWQENVRKYVEESRDVNPTIRTPELEDSTKDLLDNKITREQHLANVDNYKPVDAWDALPREPSSKAVVFSLNKEQRKDGHFVLDNASSMGVNKSSLKIGDLFNGRLDIPAYNRFDTWIVTGSSKNAEKGKHYAKAIHYTAGEGESVKFISSIKTSEKIGTGEKGKTPYATVQGYIKDLDINEIRNKATQYLNDPEWTQVGFDPRRQGGFYVRAGENKHVPVREASEVIQIGPLVLAKNAKLDMDYTGFNEGGAVMDDQMKMAFMADKVDVDPVSGNEVPPGSLPEEVRDDIPAQLSEGEYVVPADVLRFYGMKFFEDLRKNAKIELAQMEANGRIGGQPVDAAVGGYITGQPTQATMSDPYKQQQMMYRQGAPVAKGNAGYFPGGTVSLNSYGNPINNPFSNISSPTFNPGDPASNTANTNIKTNIPKPIIKDGMTYMPPSDFYVGSSLFGPAPSLQPPFTPVTLYGPNGEIVTANTQAEYDDYISQDYKTTQTTTEEEPIVYESDNDDINQEVESLTTIAQQAESDAYAETFESALAGTASEQDYINIYGNLASQQATLTGMAAINPLAAPVILKTIADRKKLNAALEKKFGADWKTTNPDLAAKFKEIDDMTMADRLKAGYGQFKEDMSSIFKDKEEEKFKPEYSVYGLSMGGDMPTVEQLSTALGDGANLSGIVSTEGGGYVTLLSQQEQSAYDRAVKMGNGVAARHYAIINASRVKRLLDKGIKGLNDGEIEKLGLKKPKPIVPVSSTSTSTTEPGISSGSTGESQAAAEFGQFDDMTAEERAEAVEELTGVEVSGEQQAAGDTPTSDEESSTTTSGTIFNKGGLASKPKKKKNKK